MAPSQHSSLVDKTTPKRFLIITYTSLRICWSYKWVYFCFRIFQIRNVEMWALLADLSASWSSAHVQATLGYVPVRAWMQSHNDVPQPVWIMPTTEGKRGANLHCCRRRTRRQKSPKRSCEWFQLRQQWLYMLYCLICNKFWKYLSIVVHPLYELAHRIQKLVYLHLLTGLFCEDFF